MDHSLIKDIAFSDTGFLFNPITGESFNVNPMGIGVLNYLRNGISFQEICTNLVAEFQVEPETAERDLLDFMNLLKHYQLASGDDRKKG
jgi:hypothetical protein